MCVALDLRLK